MIPYEGWQDWRIRVNSVLVPEYICDISAVDKLEDSDVLGPDIKHFTIRRSCTWKVEAMLCVFAHGNTLSCVRGTYHTAEGNPGLMAVLFAAVVMYAYANGFSCVTARLRPEYLVISNIFGVDVSDCRSGANMRLVVDDVTDAAVAALLKSTTEHVKQSGGKSIIDSALDELMAEKAGAAASF